MSLALAHKNDAVRPIDPTRDVKKIKKISKKDGVVSSMQNFQVRRLKVLNYLFNTTTPFL